MSCAFHPQMDGQTGRTTTTVEDMHRVCTLEWQGDWDRHLTLVKFAYNNSCHTSIGLTLFETLYDRCCHALGYWSDIADGKHEDSLIL